MGEGKILSFIEKLKEKKKKEGETTSPSGNVIPRLYEKTPPKVIEKFIKEADELAEKSMETPIDPEAPEK